MRSSSVETSASAQTQARRAQAADWFARLQRSDCTAADRSACRRWREADPDNDAAYAQMERIYRQSAELGMDPERRAMVQALRLGGARRARRRRAVRAVAGLAVAAGVVLALGLGWRAWDPMQPERTYASAVGEQQTFTLDDGSRVLLDTDSTLRVQYSRKRRGLVLERGQAQFTVAKAPDRPFVVTAGPVAIRAVGTQFQVRRHRDDGVQVSLLEGVVEVAAEGQGAGITLAAGEQLSLAGGGAWTRRAMDREVAEGWTRGELVFRQTSLSQLVDEMNRYTVVKFRLNDAGLGDIRLSGVFYGSDQDSLADALEQLWSLRVERGDGEIVVHRQ